MSSKKLEKRSEGRKLNRAESINVIVNNDGSCVLKLTNSVLISMFVKRPRVANTYITALNKRLSVVELSFSERLETNLKIRTSIAFGSYKKLRGRAKYCFRDKITGIRILPDEFIHLLNE